jgi:phosphatidylglycerophosphate synthase
MPRVVALNRWLIVQAVVWLPVLATMAIARPSCSGLAARIGLVVGILGSAAVLVALLGAGRRLADVVTVARLGVLCAAVFTGLGGVDGTVFTLAVAAVLLDLADGAVARRCGGSPEGAILDMETDQLATLGLAVVLVAGRGLSPWVLVLPALRYLFVLAMLAVGVAAHDPKPVDGDNRRGRRICACMFVLMLVALLPVVPRPWADGATLLAVLLLCWSFAADARFLVARARQRGGVA